MSFKAIQRKCRLFLLATVCFLALLAGCASGADLSAPSDLKMKKGVLSWTAEEGVSYEYSLDGTQYTAVESAEISLLDVVTAEGKTKVYVRGVKGKETGESAEFEVNAEKLATPEKPALKTVEDTKEKRVEWASVKDAEKYEIKVNDGKWTTLGKNYYTPNRTGTYVVTVRCKAYADSDTLYLTSNESQPSDEIDFLESPSLDCPAIHVLSMDTSVEFDSYNLWIWKSGTTEKTKYENVEFVDGEINPVQKGYITETGEYDMQVEGIKDGESWYSETYTEFGTANINANELFSFDNRKTQLSPSTQQTNVTVSNEQYRGKEKNVPGYSLKLDATNGRVTQIGLMRYVANGINDIDFRNITKISYWIYIPSGQYVDGNEVTQLSGGQLPAARYEQHLTATNEDAWAATGFYAKNDAVAQVDTWTKITLDLEVPYENILMLTVEYISNNSLVAYIDDIEYVVTSDRSAIYDAEANKPDDAEYVLVYGNSAKCSGGWYTTGRIKLSFGAQYANQSIVFKADVKGTVSSSANSTEWPKFVAHKTLKGERDDAGNVTYVGYYDIPKNIVTQTEEWKSISISTKLNANGDVYLNIANNGTVEGEFVVYLKNVTFYGTAADTQANKNSNGYVDASYDQKWIEIAVDKSVASVGDTVKITMDMYIRPDESKWESMPFAIGGVSGTYVYEYAKSYLQADKTGNSRTDNWKADELNAWHTFTFEAVVVSEQTFKRSNTDTQITAKNEQYVLLWWNDAGNGKAANNNGAKSEWYYKQPTSIENLGKTANTQANKNNRGEVDASYDHKWIEIAVDKSVASVGDTVRITMDMYIRPDESQWESMPFAISGNFASYVAGGTRAYLQADKTGNSRTDNWKAEELNGWHTFTFEAVVVSEQTFKRSDNDTQITAKNEQYVLLWWNDAGNGKAANNNGAKSEWYYKTPTSIVKA